MARRVLVGIAFTLLGAALAPTPAGAQSALEILWADLGNVPGDLLHVWSAPARIGSDDLPPLAMFTGGTLLVAANDAAIEEWVDAHEGTAAIAALEPFRSEHALLSELGRNHIIMRGMAAGYALGLIGGWDWLREASFGCALGNTANGLVRKVAYRTVTRLRPSASDDPYSFDVPGGEWEAHSFFGGHAANAFTCASFFAHRWDLGAAEPVVWALASGVALARVPEDAHWASDTLIGIAFGYFVGRTIAERYAARGAETGGDEASGGTAGGTATPPARLQVGAAPIPSTHGMGLQLTARVRF